MSQDSHNETNIDYSTGGASVLDAHDAVRREKSDAQSGIEPIGAGTLLLAAGIILLGAVYFGWHSESFSMATIYKTADYTPQAPPTIGGVAVDEDTGPWIDSWLASGKKNYGNCLACHGADGRGQPGLFPPLVDSEYVSGSDERLGGILLHGVAGPITVNGNSFNSAMQAWNSFDDQKLAQIMSYVRVNFGKLSPEDAVVTADMMKVAREKFSDRAAPWTESELLQFPADAALPAAGIDLQTGEAIGSDADADLAAPAP